jgi:hypothetical protein
MQALVGNRVNWKGRWCEVLHYTESSAALDPLLDVLAGVKTTKGLCNELLNNTMALEQAAMAI